MYIKLLTSLEDKNIANKRFFATLLFKKMLNGNTSETLGIVPCNKEKI